MTEIKKSGFLHAIRKLLPKIESKKTKKSAPKDTTSSSKLLALDINSDTCSFLRLKGKSPNYTIVDMAILTHPKPCIREGKLIEPSIAQQTLQRLISHHKIKQKHCSLAISSALVINKTLKISKNMNQSQVEVKAQHEAQKLFSEDIDDLYIDYTRTDTNDDHHNLNIVATHKADLEPYLNVLKKNRLTAKHVDIDYYALERIYPVLKNQLKSLPDDHHIALFYLTTDYFLINIFHNDEFIYSHRYDFHHENLLDFVKNIIEDNKEAPLINDDDQIAIAKAISHLLQFFYSEHKKDHIDTIILTGPLALIPNLTATIAVATHTNVSIINPFKHMQNQSSLNAEKLSHIAPAFILNLAMALKG